MKNRFRKYLTFNGENGKIVSANTGAFENMEEAFELFRNLFNLDYGSIEEDSNLIGIHTGGWSDNEALIDEFKETTWWLKYHEITMRGGHYYFNTDFYADKKWTIIKTDGKI